MHVKLAFIFPGQGDSHYIGMGKDFYDNYPIARETFEEANDLLGFDLSSLIFHGDLRELTETKNCQIALYVNSIAILRVLQEVYPFIQPHACAGLSLGEYSAITASGKLSFSEGVSIVRARGELMQKACESTQGSMAVVLGLTEDVLESLCRQAGVWIANLNSPGQIVISGETNAIQKAIILAKDHGAKRAIPLNVIGAYHSPLMLSAEKGLAPYVEHLELLASDTQLAMNVTGSIETEIEKIKSNLIRQVTQSVRWESCIRSLDAIGITHYIELGCGKVLTNLNKRIGVSGQALSIDKLEDMKNIQCLVEELAPMLGGV